VLLRAYRGKFTRTRRRLPQPEDPGGAHSVESATQGSGATLKTEVIARWITTLYLIFGTTGVEWIHRSGSEMR
jgi:hypothetical protein